MKSSSESDVNKLSGPCVPTRAEYMANMLSWRVEKLQAALERFFGCYCCDTCPSCGRESDQRKSSRRNLHSSSHILSRRDAKRLGRQEKVMSIVAGSWRRTCLVPFDSTPRYRLPPDLPSEPPSPIVRPYMHTVLRSIERKPEIHPTNRTICGQKRSDDAVYKRASSKRMLD